MSQSPIDPVEQLSAFMDGELPDAEARFLLRRLEHDAALRETWERMQLASHCLRAQPWQAMDAGFAGRVAAGIGADTVSAARRPWMRWAAAASVLALGLVLAPRMLQQPEAPASSIAEVPAPPATNILPSLGSADLVAVRQPAAAAAPAPAAGSVRESGDTRLVASVEPSDAASPLPLDSSDAESPADFPLVDNGEERSWPRSELVSGASDPAIEAYLVRHNQMIAADGLGGFVPYVDVVSNSQPAAAATDASVPEEAEGK